jgi:formylmethanofuran dehydrogenase subunit A
MSKDRFLFPGVKTKLAPCRDVDVNIKSMSRHMRFSAYVIMDGRIVTNAGSVSATTAIVAI